MPQLAQFEPLGNVKTLHPLNWSLSGSIPSTIGSRSPESSRPRDKQTDSSPKLSNLSQASRDSPKLSILSQKLSLDAEDLVPKENTRKTVGLPNVNPNHKLRSHVVSRALRRVGGSASVTGSSRKISNALDDVVADARFELDSRALLRAFRMIGGYDGIDYEELSSKIAGIRNEQIRKPLENKLGEIFTLSDLDGNGMLDVIEFERMVNNSTLMQKAVYELLATAEHEENAVNYEIEKQVDCLEVCSIILVVANVFSMAVSVDHSPGWQGWHYVELSFVCVFSLDLLIRVVNCVMTRRANRPAAQTYAEQRILKMSRTLRFGSRQLGSSTGLRGRTRCCRKSLKILAFLAIPTNLIDLLTIFTGWTEVIVIFSHGGSSTEIASIRFMRFLRFARLARLVRVLYFFPALRALLNGILSGMRSVILGLSLICLIVFLWAIFIRQSIVHGLSIDSNALKLIFPDMMRGMLVIFRCLALNCEGACRTQDGTLFEILYHAFGWGAEVAWTATEVFILLVILNVIAGVFVVQAIHNENNIREDINATKYHEDQIRLASLDKLLRTLVHPAREQSNPKDRRAAEVARLIQTDHPVAARKIPNLEKEVVSFARSIQDSKAMLQSAMDGYEAREVEACRKLRSTPSAKLYMVDGEEQLLVDQDDVNITNCLNIPLAPVGAVEVQLLQEQDTLEYLLEEAKEVQTAVKNIILPHSSWANSTHAGPSGDIWKISNMLCDEAIDPGPKDVERTEQKVFMKYGGRFERCRDYSRLGLIYKSVEHLMRALPRFLEFRFDTDGIQVVCIENRFVSAHQTGWRDMALLMKVRVPSSGSCHIMEMQLQLHGLTKCRDRTHKFYEEIRAHLPDAVVTTILDKLVTDTTLDLGITKEEWMQCLHNSEVKKLLDGLGIPQRCRATLFELVDIDGSGTVTSSELKDTLRLYRSPVQSLELAGCHLRVRDIQRHAHTKIGPQLGKMQKDLQEHVAEIECILKEFMFGYGSENLMGSTGFGNKYDSRLSRFSVMASVTKRHPQQSPGDSTPSSLIRGGSKLCASPLSSQDFNMLRKGRKTTYTSLSSGSSRSRIPGLLQSGTLSSLNDGDRESPSPRGIEPFVTPLPSVLRRTALTSIRSEASLSRTPRGASLSRSPRAHTPQGSIEFR